MQRTQAEPTALMDINLLLEIVNSRLLETHNRPLNSTEILVLRGIWQRQTYNQIAQDSGYSPGYFTNVVAPELCRQLSDLVGKRVTKKNCRALLESYVAEQPLPQEERPEQHPADSTTLDSQQGEAPRYPSGSVPLDSPFYIERPPIESKVFEEITKPGALVRIKAPKEMGKTSLLIRLLDYANRRDYSTVNLNLAQIDQEILNNLNRFLRWFCANITRQLQLEPRLDDYWDEDIGSKVSCTLYFRNHLLAKTDPPLVLALDEFNQIFEHPHVAKDVLPLLRSWYEEAKRIPIWKKLRLVVVHSTEIYVPLQLKQSPFNVGLPIQLGHFNLNQVQQLAQRYMLEWTDGKNAQQLMAMVGGHPSLVHTALYHLSRRDITLPYLLQTAATNSGIYDNHLQRHWATLQEQTELLEALNSVMYSSEPVTLEPILAHKLSSMGLIQQAGDKATPGCELYRRYFTRH